MSANIEFNKEKKTHSFVTQGNAAWHGLGVVLNDPFTAKEAIEYANLDFDVHKRPIYTTMLKDEYNIHYPHALVNEENPIKGKYATVREDNEQSLGIVGDRYEVLQNKDAFGFFDSIVGEGKAIYESAGVLGKGERIFITAKLPQKLVISPDDAIDQYIFITNSHDGSSSVQAAFTPVRVVCNNTLSLALKNSIHKVNIRHTSSLKYRLEDAGRLMGRSEERR